MARVLLIDDDPALLDMVALLLEDAGHTVETAADGREGWRRIGRRPPDLVVADVNMPQVDGFTLCRRLRAEGPAIPIVLLTSRDTPIDEALGLELGADDYVTKPFDGRVLLARIRRLVDRRPPAKTVQRGRLHLDPERLAVRYADRPVSVTVSEFRLLAALAERPGVVLDRGRLLERMRQDDSTVGERIVDTYIRRLRRKLEAVDPAFAAIETVVGAGYRWSTR